MTDIALLQQPFILPCGSVLKNRFCKSAMGENLAHINGQPSQKLFTLYHRWSLGGAGLLITGNVMVDHTALGNPRNVCVENESFLPDLKAWAEIAQRHQSALWMQINHPGRQAPKAFNRDVVAPSAIGLSAKAVFKTPRPLLENEIWGLIEKFGNSARIAKKSGFSGVQIHGAHGYLISQFLSSNTNKRTDEWGGDLIRRAKFLLEICRSVRREVGPDFPLSVKINSADFQKGAFTQEESLKVVDLLSEENVDLIEVSGGTYEKAAMMGMVQKKSTQLREAYFADFIVKARQRTKTPLMLTGGFRSIAVMAEALRNNELDLIGLARPFARNPEVAKAFLEGKIKTIPVPQIKIGIKAVDQKGFLDTLWHNLQLRRMGEGKDPKLTMSGWKALWLGMKETIFNKSP